VKNDAILKAMIGSSSKTIPYNKQIGVLYGKIPYNELPRGKPRGIKSFTSVDARQAAG
jgi:hypothetical protein